MVLSKKVIAVLIIVATLLAVVTVYFIMSDSGARVSTAGSDAGSADSGNIGVIIISPRVEDKLAGDGNGE